MKTKQVNSKSMRVGLAALTTGISAIALCAGGAVAQENSSLAVEEIIVTAQKREQSLSDVPISVSALSGDKIETSGIDDLSDLSEFVPGVHISRGPVNTSINIRGIGSGMNRSFEQSVGMYIDGIYMGRGRQYRAPFMDIERVEVLRGPQGILFGKNTIAGAINIITKNPTVGDELNGLLTVDYEGANDAVDQSLAMSIPLGEKAAIRIAGKVSDSDGFITNVPTDTSAIQPREEVLRATLVWEPSDRMDVNLKVSHAEFETTGSPLVPSVFKLIDDPKAPLDALAFALVGIAEPNFSLSDPHNSFIEPFPALGKSGPEGTNTKTDNMSLTVNYDMNNGARLTSVTGYSAFTAVDSQDVDFLPIRLLTRFDDRDFSQISQEFRIVSEPGRDIEYIAGVYAEKQDMNVNGQIALDSSMGGLTNPVIGHPSVFRPLLDAQLGAGAYDAVFPVVEISRNGDYDMDVTTWAAFAELTFNVRDDIRLIGGLRYSREEKEVSKSLFLGSDVTGGLEVPSAHPILAALWAQSFSTYAHDVTGSRTSDHVDPSVKVQWDASDNTMYYASFTQGFKSGGFNASDDLLVLPGEDPVGFEFDDEQARSYEVGMKTSFADGAARLNVSAFQTNYEDLQVSAFQGTTFAVSNAAEAEIRGIEADLIWRLTEGLTLGGSLAYLDFSFTDYSTAGCTAAMIAATLPGDTCTQDLSGSTNAFAPKWSGNLNANYYRGLSDELALNIDLDYNFKSEMYLDYDLDEDALQDGFSKVNARVAVEDKDGAWWIAAYGRNLTDEITYGFSVDTPLVTGSHSAVVNVGRTYGLQMGFRF